ncbi:MAG: hypothetical protein IKH26_06910 [Bacteroidaceae bacterium]|nr:hypothetical protein [Bacteroidaceae bacterium]
MKNLKGDITHIENPTVPTNLVVEICEKVGISPKKTMQTSLSSWHRNKKEGFHVLFSFVYNQNKFPEYPPVIKSPDEIPQELNRRYI